MSAAAHSICPNYNRCNKYLEFTLKLDAYEERDRKHLAIIAAQAKRIAELEAAQCLYDHYVSGMTLGTLARRLGLKKGSRECCGGLMEAFEAIATDPDADITDILFPMKSPNPPKPTATRP